MDDSVEPGDRVSSRTSTTRRTTSTAAPSSSPRRSRRRWPRSAGKTFGAAGRADEGRGARAASASSIRSTRATSLGVLGDYVTLDAGTGAVHTAPGHGADDFQHRHEVRPGDLRADRPGGTLPRHRGAVRRPARVRREPEGRGGAERARPAVAPRGVLAPVPALLALPQPGHLPRDVAVVHPLDGRRRRARAEGSAQARCARRRSTRSITT